MTPRVVSVVARSRTCGAMPAGHGTPSDRRTPRKGDGRQLVASIGTDSRSDRLRPMAVNRVVIGLCAMARPGLEPGTPRFSDSRVRASNRREIPAIRWVARKVWALAEVRKSRSLVADVGHELDAVAHWGRRVGVSCTAGGNAESCRRLLLVARSETSSAAGLRPASIRARYFRYATEERSGGQRSAVPLSVRSGSQLYLTRRFRFCLKATAMVLDLHPIGSSSAPSLCLCTGRNASGQVALPWVVAKRAPRRHRLRTPAFMRERGAECRMRIPIRTDRLR